MPATDLGEGGGEVARGAEEQVHLYVCCWLPPMTIVQKPFLFIWPCQAEILIVPVDWSIFVATCLANHNPNQIPSPCYVYQFSLRPYLINTIFDHDILHIFWGEQYFAFFFAMNNRTCELVVVGAQCSGPLMDSHPSSKHYTNPRNNWARSYRYLS